MVASLTAALLDWGGVCGRDSLTKLSELAVADDESSKSSETFQRLVTVLSGGVPADGGIWRRGVFGAAHLLGLPDEILEKVAIVLGEGEDLGLFDDVTEVSDQLLAFSREPLGRARKASRCECAIQCDVDLLVL